MSSLSINAAFIKCVASLRSVKALLLQNTLSSVYLMDGWWITVQHLELNWLISRDSI